MILITVAEHTPVEEAIVAPHITEVFQAAQEVDSPVAEEASVEAVAPLAEAEHHEVFNL